jgi:hypothetical protein
MDKHAWKEDAACRDFDVNLFFDTYEEDIALRPAIDKICSECPVMKTCFAVGISQKETGVWGGIYMDRGKISREFNKHRNKKDWAEKWKDLTIEEG